MHYQLIPKTKVFSDIKTIQTLLKRVGFYKGEINGQSGPETLQAVKELQKSKSRRRTQTKTLKKRG
ncbi:MAG: peptidoglycan-binding protein [Candidatus Omnitrophota bacterium]